MRGLHENTKSLQQQGLERLNIMYDDGEGRSRHQDKKTKNGTQNRIYSINTKATYTRGWLDFCDTMRRKGYKCNGHSPRTFAEAVGFVQPYIDIVQARPGRMGAAHASAWTVTTRAAAVCKVLGLDMADYDLPRRARGDIRRSRTETVGDRHFSMENNRELVVFCRTTGLRNNKELRRIRGSDLLLRDDGRWAIRVQGKGGRVREAGLYGPDEDVALVLRRMQDAGGELVWPHVHSNADPHAWRAEYAVRVYQTYAREPASLAPEERYCCRGDMRGVWLDRKALELVSRELGHNRVSVVAGNYLYRLPAEPGGGPDTCHP